MDHVDEQIDVVTRSALALTKTAAPLQRKQLDLLQAKNRDLAAQSGAPDAVDGVIKSYELAFRMQTKVPELLDISREPK